MNMVMLGASQINNEVNETIEAMTPPSTDMVSIYELKVGNFTSSGNISMVTGISRILSVMITSSCVSLYNKFRNGITATEPESELIRLLPNIFLMDMK